MRIHLILRFIASTSWLMWYLGMYNSTHNLWGVKWIESLNYSTIFLYDSACTKQHLLSSRSPCRWKHCQLVFVFSLHRNSGIHALYGFYKWLQTPRADRQFSKRPSTSNCQWRQPCWSILKTSHLQAEQVYFWLASSAKITSLTTPSSKSTVTQH